MSNFGDHPAGFFGVSGFYNGVATQSLRFDDGSSAYLTRTPDNAGNTRTFTFSAWLKRSTSYTSLASGQIQAILSVWDGSSDFGLLAFSGQAQGAASDTVNEIIYYDYDAGADFSLELNRSFGDTSAWYHLVFAVDTTDGTQANRVKYYINGELQTTNTNAHHAAFPQNRETGFNRTDEHAIGRWQGQADRRFNGYMAEINFVDGTQYDASYFGETKNGVWIPKEPDGVTYGTNGYRLQFKNTGTGTASSSTIGADTSGNNNHWTSAGIAASDCNMLDSPENNFCTLNTLDKVDLVLAEGNLKTTGAGNSFDTIRSTFAMSSGSWYAEFLCHAGTGNGNNHVGISTQSEALSGISGSNFLGSSATSYSYSDNDNVYNNGSITNSTGTTYVAGDIIGVTFTGSEIKWYKNNSLIATVSSITGNDYCFTTTSYSTSMGMFANFGQDSSFAGAKTAQGNTDGNGNGDFFYTPPSGFLALCSANLPELTIGPNSGIDEQSDDYFQTVLYTGNATDDTAIAVDFQPDWTWIKKISGAQEHVLFDSSRGATKRLFSNLTNAESAEATSLKAFTSSGFTLGTHSSVNDNTETFVAWNWKANGGTTTTNDASATSVGSIDSVIQANTEAGFSIVQFETNSGTSGSAQTVAHGLSQAPTFMILKSRDQAGTTWQVYYGDNTDYLRLNSTGATIDGASTWNDTSPTNTVFSIGTNGGDTNNTNGGSMIAYVFHEVEGYSKFGSYTGNGSNDGTFLYTGFSPAFIMIKRIDATMSWVMLDNKRDSFNSNFNSILFPDLNEAANTGANKYFNFVSNGFKFRGTSAAVNASGAAYIYMAFAEAPFKYANAR